MVEPNYISNGADIKTSLKTEIPMSIVSKILELYLWIRDVIRVHPILYIKPYCRFKIRRLYKKIPAHEFRSHRYITGKT
jgi:hypothetical protein